MRILKYFSYEAPFLSRESLWRSFVDELMPSFAQGSTKSEKLDFKVSRISLPLNLQSKLSIFFISQYIFSLFSSAALAFSIPVLASTPAFVTHTHVTKEFDPAVIFTSLSLFQVTTSCSPYVLIDDQFPAIASPPAHDVTSSCVISYFRCLKRAGPPSSSS